MATGFDLASLPKERNKSYVLPQDHGALAVFAEVCLHLFLTFLVILTCRLIVNYLPQSLTDEQLCTLFSKIGPVVSAKIIRDLNTNYSYGYGFVEMACFEDAEEAVKQLKGMKSTHTLDPRLQPFCARRICQRNRSKPRSGLRKKKM